LVLEVEAPGDPDLRALLVEELLALPTRGVEERGDVLVVHIPTPVANPDEFLEEVRERLRRGTGLDAPVVRHRWQDHEEWSESWRRGLRPRRVTERLVVSPSWEDPALTPGEILLTLDPGLAFGTAEHPTTRGCLRLLDRVVRPGDLVADAGAGSGILSIAAALLGASRVVAVEMDPWSCTAARENVLENGVEDRVEIREEVIGSDFLPDEPPFDGVVANIESGILASLLPGLWTAVRPGGWLIMSGIMAHEAPNFLEQAAREGLVLRERDQEENWWSGLFMGEGEAGDLAGHAAAAPGGA